MTICQNCGSTQGPFTRSVLPLMGLKSPAKNQLVIVTCKPVGDTPLARLGAVKACNARRAKRDAKE